MSHSSSSYQEFTASSASTVAAPITQTYSVNTSNGLLSQSNLALSQNDLVTAQLLRGATVASSAQLVAGSVFNASHSQAQNNSNLTAGHVSHSIASVAQIPDPCCSSVFLSDVEQAILRSNVPVEITETEEISVNGQTGLWANRQEVLNWKGQIPINQYTVNEDVEPEIITKRTDHSIEFVQELAVRYLRPPT
jgi:hypothetical protein